jgi:signal transduction histidine kinase/ligand-binding sensor domain-containing protein
LIRFLLLALLLVNAVESFCQVLPFHIYDTKNGLISNIATSLFQDSRGLLWIGTYDGVSLYDGATFKNYTMTDGLAHHLAWCIAESRVHRGTIFIGTDGGGISKFQNGSFQTIRLGSNLAANRVVSIVEDTRGCLWSITHDGLYLVVSEDSIVKLQLDDDISYLSTVGQTPNGDIWVPIKQKIHRYNEQREITATITVPLAQGASIYSMSVDSDGNLWVSSTDSTLLQYREGTLLQRRHMLEGAPGNVLVDHQGKLWIAVGSQGVFTILKSHFGNGCFQHVVVPPGLKDNFWPMLVDREDNIWFISWGKGIVKLEDRSILHFPSRVESGRGGGVDSNDHFWTASLTDVLEFWSDSLGWHSFSHKLDTQPGNLTMDSSGHVWVCCSDSSIRSYAILHRSHRPSQLLLERRFKAGIDLPKGLPFMCLVDRKGFLWVALEHDLVGVIDLKGSNRLERILRAPHELPVHSIRCMYEDRHGNLWFGTYEGGVVQLPGADWRHPKPEVFSTTKGFSDGGVRSISEDEEGRLWIGMRYGGIAIYDGNSVTTLTETDGLLSNAVWSLAKGHNGTIWAGTSLGLMQIESKAPYHMKRNNELAGLTTWTCIVDTGERVLAMTSVGGMIYSTSEDVHNIVPPPVYITQVTSNGQLVDARAGLELSHGKNNIVIDFVGISLRNEKGIRYRYRLKDIDRDWSSPIALRSIAYSSLMPGEYTFEVVALNADGVESTTAAMVSFTILPPFWSTWWFVTIFWSTVVLSVGGTIRYVEMRKIKRTIERLEQEKALERERSRISQDLHDDIGASLSRIALFSEVAKEEALTTSPRMLELSQKIGDNARELLDAVGALVWSIDPRHERFEDLITHMKNFAQEMFTLKNIDYTFKVDPAVSQVSLPMDARKNILLIFKEAVNNIVKHSHCRTAHVGFSVDKDTFTMTIEDDGGKVAHRSVRKGHGIDNMKARATNIQGELSIDMGEEGGTKVRLTVPLPT